LTSSQQTALTTRRNRTQLDNVLNKQLHYWMMAPENNIIILSDDSMKLT